MATPELIRSWARTEGYLRDARSHFSQIAEAEFRDDLNEFEEFIEHNELGLAFGVLASVAEESEWETLNVLELLALAAASMGLSERRREIDARISQLKGAAHETSLPSADA